MVYIRREVLKAKGKSRERSKDKSELGRTEKAL